VRGAHQFGFGGSVQPITLDARLADRFAGIFLFPTLNDFTRGTPDVFLQAFGDPHTRYTSDPAAFWAQDQWRPAAGLTVIAGLRYEFQSLPAPSPGSPTAMAAGSSVLAPAFSMIVIHSPI
jgi:outer membrane receptor protein involved in Fe transport